MDIVMNKISDNKVNLEKQISDLNAIVDGNYKQTTSLIKDLN